MTSESPRPRPRKVAITGGTGVLGRHLVRHLQSSRPDFDLTLIGRTQRTEDSSLGDTRYVCTDYSTDSLSRSFASADVVVHLAASRSSSPRLEDHYQSLELAEQVFEVASAAGADIVFASSISVYGAVQQLPVTEEQVPHAKTPYGVLKFAAESLGLGIAERNGVHFAALRLAHLYGAGEVNAYMVNTFMARAKQNETLHLRERPVVKRDFLYAGDAAIAIDCAVQAGAHGTYNIGSGQPVTNFEIAQAVVEGFESSSSIVIDRPDDLESILPTHMATRLASEELGFARRYTHVEAFREISTIGLTKGV